jgi:hypothetical protein
MNRDEGPPPTAAESEAQARVDVAAIFAPFLTGRGDPEIMMRLIGAFEREGEPRRSWLWRQVRLFNEALGDVAHLQRDATCLARADFAERRAALAATIIGAAFILSRQRSGPEFSEAFKGLAEQAADTFIEAEDPAGLAGEKEIGHAEVT